MPSSGKAQWLLLSCLDATHFISVHHTRIIQRFKHVKHLTLKPTSTQYGNKGFSGRIMVEMFDLIILSITPHNNNQHVQHLMCKLLLVVVTIIREGNCVIGF